MVTVELDPPHYTSWLNTAKDEFYDWSNAIIKFNPMFAKPIGQTLDPWGAAFWMGLTLATLYAIKKYR